MPSSHCSVYALKNMGSGRLMGFIDNVCPSANEMPPQKTISGELLPWDANAAPYIFIYKTTSQPHIAEMSFFTVYSGTIQPGMEFLNESNRVAQTLNRLVVVE